MRYGRMSPAKRGREVRSPEIEEKIQLNGSFAGGAAKVDRFVFQIVNGADVADGATAGTHKDRVGDGFMTDEFDPWQKWAFDNACRAKDRAFSCYDISRAKYGLNLFFGNTMDFAGFSLGIRKPHT